MHRFVLILVTVASLASCAGVSRFEKGELVAFAQPLEGSPEPLYYLIRFNIDTTQLNSLMFLLKLTPEAEPLRANRLSPETVSRHLPAFRPPEQWPETWKRKAKEFQTFEGNGFNISFKDGRLTFLGICSHCSGERTAPMVGRLDGRAFYTLPLTQPQMIDVFGVPDSVRKVREVTYDR